MHNTSNQTFKIVAAITGYTLRKSADGVEKYVLSGMASTTNIDLTGERMADTALSAMVKSLESNPVTINNEHGSSWDDDFGEVTRLWVTDSHELMMEAELDPDHYRTKTLIKALDKGKKLGLSIGGVVKEAAMEWFADLSRKVMTYKDIALFHVAITGTPAVADTWVTPITKSVKDWKETPMPNDEVAKTDVLAQEVVDETPVETPVEAPADEPVIEESVPAEDEVSDAPDVESAPVDPEAPAQEDEADELATPSEEPAPEPANDDTSEVNKSAIFGAFAEADVAEVSVRALTSELCWQVWRAVYTDEEDERTPQERKAHVAAALSEYSALVQKVANVFIDNGTTADAEKSFIIPDEATITKSLIEKDAKVEELTKSLSERDDELETAKKSLQEKETELEKYATRKGIVFDKFTGQEAQEENHDEVVKASQEKFASFIVTGAR